MSKENRDYMLIVVIALVIGLLARWAWAEFVYDDPRCILGECRIVK